MHFDEQTGEMVENEEDLSPYDVVLGDGFDAADATPDTSAWDLIMQNLQTTRGPEPGTESSPTLVNDRFHITDPDWLQLLQDAPPPLINEAGFIGDTDRQYANPDPYGTADLPSIWETETVPTGVPAPPGKPGKSDRVRPDTNMTDAEILAAERAAELNNAHIALFRRQVAYEDAKIAALQAKAADGTATPTDLSNLFRLRAQRDGLSNDFQSATDLANSLALKREQLAQEAAQFAQTLGLSRERLAFDTSHARANQTSDLLAALTNMAGRISPTLIQEAMMAIRSLGNAPRETPTPTPPALAMMPSGPAAQMPSAPASMPELPATMSVEPAISLGQALTAAGTPPPVQGRPLLDKFALWAKVSRPPTGQPDPLDVADWRAGRYTDSGPAAIGRAPQLAPSIVPVQQQPIGGQQPRQVDIGGRQPRQVDIGGRFAAQPINLWG